MDPSGITRALQVAQKELSSQTAIGPGDADDGKAAG